MTIRTQDACTVCGSGLLAPAHHNEFMPDHHEFSPPPRVRPSVGTEAWFGPPEARIRVVVPAMPLLAFVEHVTALTRAAFERTGKAGVLSLSVTEELGLALGLSPGGSNMVVMTEVGMVELRVVPSATPGTVSDPIRAALADAIREIGEHNLEHDHATPESKLEEWRRLLGPAPEPGSLKATFDRLDAAGRDPDHPVHRTAMEAIRRKTEGDARPADHGDVTACFECKHCDRVTRVEARCVADEHPTKVMNPPCPFCREDMAYVGFTMGPPDAH